MAVANTLIKANAAALYDEINNGSELTSSTLATNDLIGIGDVSAATGAKITVANLATYIKNNYYFNSIVINTNQILLGGHDSSKIYSIPSDTKILNLYQPSGNTNDAGYRGYWYFIIFTNSLIKTFSFHTYDSYRLGTSPKNDNLKLYNNSTLLETIEMTRQTGDRPYAVTRSGLTNCNKIIHTWTSWNTGGGTAFTVTITKANVTLTRVNASSSSTLFYYATLIK